MQDLLKIDMSKFNREMSNQSIKKEVQRQCFGANPNTPADEIFWNIKTVKTYLAEPVTIDEGAALEAAKETPLDDTMVDNFVGDGSVESKDNVDDEDDFVIPSPITEPIYVSEDDGPIMDDNYPGANMDCCGD